MRPYYSFVLQEIGISPLAFFAGHELHLSRAIGRISVKIILVSLWQPKVVPDFPNIPCKVKLTDLCLKTASKSPHLPSFVVRILGDATEKRHVGTSPLLWWRQEWNGVGLGLWLLLGIVCVRCCNDALDGLWPAGIDGFTVERETDCVPSKGFLLRCWLLPVSSWERLELHLGSMPSGPYQCNYFPESFSFSATL